MFRSLVFPKGNVHKNYLSYVGWSFLSNIIVSVESVLSTHSMLSVIGQASNDILITTNYIGKDLVGQMGSLWYMNKMGQKADKEPSKFIKYSMAFQQSSILVECATPLLPSYLFIPIAGCANIGKNISFTCFGAINARVIQKLAMEDNIGEIYAKVSVLNTLGSSIGMGLGLLLASLIPDHTLRLGLFPILAGLRMYSYNKSVEGLL